MRNVATRKGRTEHDDQDSKENTSPVSTESSGNVFAELGLPNAEQESKPAKPSIKQPHVSLLIRNRAGSFSVGRLMEFLTVLGQDMEIAIRPSRKEHGEMSLMIG